MRVVLTGQRRNTPAVLSSRVEVLSFLIGAQSHPYYSQALLNWYDDGCNGQLKLPHRVWEQEVFDIWQAQTVTCHRGDGGRDPVFEIGRRDLAVHLRNEDQSESYIAGVMDWYEYLDVDEYQILNLKTDAIDIWRVVYPDDK